MKLATQIIWALAIASVLTMAAKAYDAGATSAKGPGTCYPVASAIADQYVELQSSTPKLRSDETALEPLVEALTGMVGYKSRTVRAALLGLATATVEHHDTLYRPALEAHLARVLVGGLLDEVVSGRLHARYLVPLLSHLYCGGEPI